MNSNGIPVSTDVVTHFRKPLWSALGSLLVAVAVVVIALRDQKTGWMLLVAIAPILHAAAESFWSIRYPLLTVAPWSITYRPGLFRRERVVSRAEVLSWTQGENQILINLQGNEVLVIKIGALREGDRQRLFALLKTFAYGRA
jgi:hypothetical protein